MERVSNFFYECFTTKPEPGVFDHYHIRYDINNTEEEFNPTKKTAFYHTIQALAETCYGGNIEQAKKDARTNDIHGSIYHLKTETFLYKVKVPKQVKERAAAACKNIAEAIKNPKFKRN